MEFAAGDARPYALAVLFAVASTLTLVRWADDQRPWLGAVYVVLVAATLYAHYLSALALVAHPLYVAKRRRELRPAVYAFAVVGVAALMLPAFPQLRALFVRRAELEVPLSISFVELFTILLPPVLVGGLVLAGLVSRRWDRPSIDVEPPSAGGATLAGVWWLLPPTILYLVSRVSSTTLFEPRYLFFSTPGLALAAALATRAISPPRSRRVIAVGVAMIAVFAFASRTHSGEDWRAAADAVNRLADPSTPVLVRPAFIESTDVGWVREPGKRQYLLSVLRPYPMEGAIIAVPYEFSADAERYLDSFTGRLDAADRFLLVNDYGGFRAWLDGRLAGFSSRLVARGGIITVILFERTS
jgi:hypothetical protein